MLDIDVDIIVGDNGVPPNTGTKGSAGYDLYIPKNFCSRILQSGETLKIDLDIAIWIKDPTVVGLIFPRSSMAKRGLILANTVGVIDSDYQGNLSIVLRNVSNSFVTIDPMDRLVQLVFVPVYGVNFVPCDRFEEETERGAGGFGSTGK